MTEIRYKFTDLFDTKITELKFSKDVVTENREDHYFGGGTSYIYNGNDPIDITIVYSDDSEETVKDVVSFEAWINRSVEQSFLKIKEYANKIAFYVTNEGWIHDITPCKVFRNKDNSFDVKFYIYWDQKEKDYTWFCYENVPKDQVFDLVTGPTFYSNGTPYYCFSIDHDRLKKFIDKK